MEKKSEQKKGRKVYIDPKRNVFFFKKKKKMLGKHNYKIIIVMI